MNEVPQFYRRARVTPELLATFIGRPWQPAQLGQRGKILVISSERGGVDRWAWMPEGTRVGVAMTLRDFTAMKRAEAGPVGALRVDGTLVELVLTYTFRPCAEGSSLWATLVPSPAPVAPLSEALALDVLAGNKGRGSWSVEHEERWLYATLLEPREMHTWNRVHPVEKNTTVAVAPAGTTVLVTMFSGWGGDVGIRARDLTPGPRLRRALLPRDPHQLEIFTVTDRFSIPGPFTPMALGIPTGPAMPTAFRGNCACGRWLVVLESYTPSAPLRCECRRSWFYEAGGARQVPFRVMPALCLDLDNTVRGSRSGCRFGPTSAADVVLLPGVENELAERRGAGFYLVGISNQGVVGFGSKTEVEVEAIASATCAAFTTNPFHDLIMSYALAMEDGGRVDHHARHSLLRKPRYGMLVLAEGRALERGVVIDWSRSIFVGDRPEDQGCADAADVEFRWAWEFFGWPAPPL